MPFLHGSQGCATYMRRYIISHFNEPIDIASSSLGEKHAIYGGGPNLKLGLRNVTDKYKPGVIGLATTCLTETIGDNVPMLLREYIDEFGSKSSPTIVSVSTPSYSGTHMEGFHAAVRAAVEQLTVEDERKHAGVNLLSGFVSAADIRYLKEVGADFHLQMTVMPDYSETLDGTVLDDYPLIPEGGTPVEEIRTMGGAAATAQFGPDEFGVGNGFCTHARLQAVVPEVVQREKGHPALVERLRACGNPMPVSIASARRCKAIKDKAFSI